MYRQLVIRQLSILTRKQIFLLVLFLQVVFVFVLYGKQTKNSSLPTLYSMIPWIAARDIKTILIWNSANRIETAAFGFGRQTFFQQGCDIKECVVFDNKTSILPLEEYDAIIIHMHELRQNGMPNFTRRAHQRLIYLTQESPVTSPYISAAIHGLGNLFNWTMTYKLNSDVQLLYGRILPESTAPKTLEETHRMIEAMHFPSAKNYAANKTRLAVWMASHCTTNSLRETYVKELSKYIPVDIYSGCGNFSCPRNGINWLSYPECYDELETKYKFYLSFENSICNDYVTEKFFEIMNHNMIPIVYGGANYSQFAPHHSYINALDFTPEKLAQYLLLLDANDNFYNEYFWWKDHYRVESGVEQMARHGFCDLCKKLHHEEGVTKFYPELVSEWHVSSQCKRMDTWEITTTTQSTSTTSTTSTDAPSTTTEAASTTESPDSKRMHEKIKSYLVNKLQSIGFIVDREKETTTDSANTTASP
jgi:alpha-1,3-fucosyltransferase